MSGGSHNYLSSRIEESISSDADAIWAMAKALRESGFLMMADRTQQLASALHKVVYDSRPMLDLWHEQEWHDSGDVSVGNVRREAIKLGEVLPPCEHPRRQQVHGFTDGFKQGPMTFMSCPDCCQEWPEDPGT